MNFLLKDKDPLCFEFQRQRSSAESKGSNHGGDLIGSTTIGSTLIDDDQTIIHSPKTNGNARVKQPDSTPNKTRRPSIAHKALGAVKRSFNIKSGKLAHFCPFYPQGRTRVKSKKKSPFLFDAQKGLFCGHNLVRDRLLVQ